MTIYGEGTSPGSSFCSTTRERQSLHHGCMGYLTYVMDTQIKEKGSISISDVPVVCNFPDVFPEAGCSSCEARRVSDQSNHGCGTDYQGVVPSCTS